MHSFNHFSASLGPLWPLWTAADGMNDKNIHSLEDVGGILLLGDAQGPLQGALETLGLQNCKVLQLKVRDLVLTLRGNYQEEVVAQN